MKSRKWDSGRYWLPPVYKKVDAVGKMAMILWYWLPALGTNLFDDEAA